MKFRSLGACLLVLAIGGNAAANDKAARIAAATVTFHGITKSTCGFTMTAESAEKAVIALGITTSPDSPLLWAAFAICDVVKKTGKTKTVEFQVKDSRKVMRKIVVEKAPGWF